MEALPYERTEACRAHALPRQVEGRSRPAVDGWLTGGGLGAQGAYRYVLFSLREAAAHTVRFLCRGRCFRCQDECKILRVSRHS